MKKIFCLSVCTLLCSWLISCRSDKDYTHQPPSMRLDSLYTQYTSPSISSYQSYSFDDDTMVTVVTATHSGTTIKLFYELHSEDNMEQLDVQLYNVQGAKFVRPSQDTISLNGNAALQWENTSVRTGFLAKNHDKFQIYIPSLLQEGSVVVLATDESGYQYAYTILLKHN